jgi:ketosteroid isomerase-like protein
MKRAALIMAAVVLLGGSVFASAAESLAETSSDEAQLLALDQAWIEAEVEGDRDALERILHEDFLATFASGKTVDRSAFIDMISQSEIRPFEVIHDMVRVHGDTALVIDLGADRLSKYTWIAIKRGGQWRVISETFSEMAAPR